jgi:WG containing repeat
MLSGCGRRATPPAPQSVAPASAAQSAGVAPRSVPSGFVRVSDAGGRVGFIDRTGAVLLEPQFAGTDVLRQSEGLVAVRQHGLWGYLDDQGHSKIAATFAKASPFSQGLAAASLPADPRTFGYVDATGHFAIAPRFDAANPFCDGRAIVVLNGARGYLDRAGTFLPTAPGITAFDFKEGLAKFTSDERFGFLNQKGEVAVPARFDSAFDFSEGFAAVRVGKLWGYIDVTGKYLVSPRFVLAESFSCGIAKVAMNQTELGFIDAHGKQFGRFQANADCRNGYAAVQQGELWGFIDPSGALVIAPKFERFEGGFVEGLAAVAERGRPFGYVGPDGKYAVEPRFSLAQEFVNGLARVEQDHAGTQEFGYIDHRGAFVWGPFRAKP